MTLETSLIISTFNGSNNSPVFSFKPLASACLNTGCFIYNPGATDVDGDSLSYSLLPCNASGYSYPAAANTFSINNVTGTLSWCNPTIAGDYNVIIKIEEWRKNGNGSYSLYGYVNRDTQFTVENCTQIKEISEGVDLLTISPNPFSNVFELNFKNVATSNYTIELHDISGKIISSLVNEMPIMSKETLSFTLQDINQGMYFLKVISQNQTITQKIIKQ